MGEKTPNHNRQLVLSLPVIWFDVISWHRDTFPPVFVSPFIQGNICDTSFLPNVTDWHGIGWHHFPDGCFFKFS